MKGTDLLFGVAVFVAMVLLVYALIGGFDNKEDE